MSKIWRELAEKGCYADAIVEYVKHYGKATFVEIQRKLSPYMEVTGEYLLESRVIKNLIIWEGLSKELAEILLELHNNKQIIYESTDISDYTSVGVKINLPILEEIPKEELTEPHWYPYIIKLSKK